MAFPRITTTFAGDRNQGLQVGYNSGSIHIAAAERPETPPKPSCFVPFRRDPDFVDRARLLDQIYERCSAPASRVALVGLGGVGKSQLAIEYCYRTTDRSPKTWVLWAHASNLERLEQSFREIAELVKVRGRKDPQADVFKLVHDWLRDEKNGPWLLILDNADDAAILSARASDSRVDDGGSANNSRGALHDDLSRYLPPSRHGSVLVTSRTRQAAMQVVEDSDIIPVEPMDNAAAHTLLYQKLGDKGKKSYSNSEIAELAAALDCMPLALVQATAYIRQRAPRCSVQQYLEEYRQSDSRASSLLNQGAGHLRRDKAASNTILISWQISFDHMRRSRQSAADLLSLMSFFDRQGIPEALLYRKSSTTNKQVQNASVKDEFEDDLLLLRNYSFVTVTTDKDTFEMHSLVQLATRKWLESQGQLDKWRELFISNLCAELPNGNYENWERCQALFPHAKAALAQRPASQKSLEEWALLLYNAAWYAWRRGRAGEAEQLSVLSMEVRKEVLGDKSVDTLWSMNMMGLAMADGGQYKEAELIHRQTLEMQERVLGPEHPVTLSSMNNLASVLSSQGEYKEAESINRQTLEIKERVLGPEHPNTLSSMNNLAHVLDSQGEYKEAELLHRQTLETTERVLGPEHPDTLLRVHNLAYVLESQGCHDESLTLYDRACARFSIVLGKDHPYTQLCWENRSEMLARREQTSLAALDNGVSVRTGKVSRLSRGLAKLRIGSSKRREGVLRE